MMTPLSPWGPPPEWLDRARRRVEEGLARAGEAFRALIAPRPPRRRRPPRPPRPGPPEPRERPTRPRWRERLAALRLPAAARPGLSRVRAGWARLSARVDRVGDRLRPHVLAALRSAWRRRLSPRRAAILGLVLFLSGWVLWERCGLAGCPDVDRLASYQPGGASVLLDRNGEEFAALAPMAYEVVALDSLPPYVAEAFVAVEDRRFWEHGGVDWVRSFGALLVDLRAGAAAQGASTIPMQLSRTLFPDRIRREEKTIRRKLLEVRMAGEIEDRFTKREILELYLNHVYLGGGSYGIQAASRYWFEKDATGLTLPEAAMLAALPRAPSHYDPRENAEAARSRRDLVLTLMERQEYLTFAEAQAARETALAVADEPDRDRDGDRLGPWFVEEVRRQLGDSLGERLYAEPLRIFTTLDVDAQRAAEAELAAQLRRVEQGWYGRYRGTRYDDDAVPDSATRYLQGAVVILDARTGEVRAWVGGRDHDHSRYDRARLAHRQAGSAFKPFVYAAALEAGLVPSQPILDAPYSLARAGSGVWTPENYDGGFEGVMTMRQALTRSQNVPAVRLAAAVGHERVGAVTRRLGIEGDVPASPVAALGVTVATPLEMASAYAAFATLGERPAPRFVLRVESADGEVLWESEPARARVMRPDVAWLMTDLLRDVVDRGTGASVRREGFWGPAAGKTGTTSDATDVWFVGFTPELVGAVWVGYDEVRPLPRGATGGGIAAPIWGRIMATVYDGRSGGEWPAQPGGIVARRVDPETGMALEEGCYPRWGQAHTEFFLPGTAPAATCPRRWDYERGWGRWWDRWFGTSSDAPRIPGRTDPDLGVPRLPTAQDRADDDIDRADDDRHDRDRDDDWRRRRDGPVGRPWRGGQ